MENLSEDVATTFRALLWMLPLLCICDTPRNVSRFVQAVLFHGLSLSSSTHAVMSLSACPVSRVEASSAYLSRQCH